MAAHTQLTGILSVRLGALLALVIHSLTINPAGGISISLVPPVVKRGNTVLMNVDGISGTILSFSWYKDAPSADNQILNYFPTSSPPQTNGNSYISGATAYPNATLSIPGAGMSHGGVYTVQVQTNAEQLQASTTLTVEYRLLPFEIVGICIGVLVVLGAGVGGLLWFLKYKKKKPENNAERPKESYANVDKSDNE